MSTVLRSLQAGLRLLRTSPGVAVPAIVALAMGIGFTATMFAIVRGSSRPLPVPHAEQIVAVRKTAVRGAEGSLNTHAHDLAVWRAAGSFEALGSFQTTAVNLSGGGTQAERVAGAIVSANAFDVLGVGPATGRGFTADDARAGAEPVVMLSDRLWRIRYAAAADIVGSVIRLDGRPHTVVGVMPPGMGFPINARLWTPLADGPAAPGTGPAMTVFGRLRGGVSVDTARAEIGALTSGIAAHSPDTHAGVGAEVLPFTEIETPREIIRGLQLLVVAVSMVLLIACGNVASLLVVRGASRAREVATRIAIGASRRQLVAEHLGESLTLSIIAAGLGLGLAHVAVRAFGAGTAHIIEAFWVDFRVDALVVLFASALAAISTAAAGLGPALRISSTNAIDVLKDRSAGTTSARLGRVARRMPGAQIAMACGLLALTVVFGRASMDLRSKPWPFDAARILSAQYGPTPEAMSDQDRRNRLLTALVTGLEQQPGVEAAAVVSALPGKGSGEWGLSLDVPHDRTRPPHTTAATFVTPGFFDVVGAGVLAGRGLTWQDDANAPAVAVATESFVRRFSADRDPLGRRVYLGSRELTIVGIVPDLMPRDIDEPREDGIYVPILQVRPYAVRVVARGTGDPLALTGTLRRATAAVDPDLPLFEIFTLREAALRDKAVLDILSSLFLLFGAGALGLTAIGLYGVVSFAVTQRTREFGIRLALGATRRDIARMVASQGAWQILGGVAAGIVIAFALTRGFAAAIENAPRADAQVFAVIAGAVAVTACAAMAAPVWRAMRVQVAAALRHG